VRLFLWRFVLIGGMLGPMSTSRMPHPDPLAEIDLTGKQYLSPGEVAHVARNVFLTGIGPMSADMQYLKNMLRRMVGDGDDTCIPETLRDKGLLYEIKDAQTSNHAEGVKAFGEIHKELADAATDRDQIKENQAEIQARVAHLEAAEVEKTKQQHRTRRFISRLWKGLTRKDDPFTVAILKIAGLLAAPVTIGIGMWKLLVLIGHLLVRFGKYIT
jgi:hypothetical protein